MERDWLVIDHMYCIIVFSNAKIFHELAGLYDWFVYMSQA